MSLALRSRIAGVLAGIAALLAAAAGTTRLAGSPADVGIAVDPATAAPAATPVALAIDRGAVRAPTTTRTAAALTASATGPTLTCALATATLFGDQVFRNLGLVEILVLGNRSELCGSRRRRADLGIPDRAERRRARPPRGGGHLGLLILIFVEGLVAWGSCLRGLAGRQGLPVSTAAPPAAPAATSTSPATARLTLAVEIRVAFGRRRWHGLRIDVERRQLLVFER